MPGSRASRRGQEMDEDSDGGHGTVITVVTTMVTGCIGLTTFVR
jgi:hypothetical protein